MVAPPQEGAEAPEFNLPGAQGGQLRLDLRTAHGPVIVVFYRGVWSEECVEYFRALAEKEREINVAGATLVGIGPVEPDEAREFVRETGFKSYVLYDYLRVATRDYGLLRKDPEHGDTVRPAVFLIGHDHTVLRAWLDERPAPEDLLAEVSGVTGLPKEPDPEDEEKPKKRPRKAAEGETTDEKAGEKEDPAAESDEKSRTGKAAEEGTEPPETAGAGESSASSEGGTDKTPDARKEGAGADAESGEEESSGESAVETEPDPASQEGGGESPPRDEER
jgi:peroxiredoxin